MNDTLKLVNVHLDMIETDHFHHFGFNTANRDVKQLFSDVKFVCASGSAKRILRFATFVQKTLNINGKEELKDLCLTDRYSMYKIGSVLAVSHGMGVPSLTILFHELFKLLYYAGAKNVVVFRMGTSGGVGVEPGTVVVTKRAVDGLLRPYHEQMVLGKLVQYGTELGNSLAEELVSYSKEEKFAFDVTEGDTMCCHDFYEGQARLDGAFCEYTQEEKMEFLNKAYSAGVRNIEMEAIAVASMCRRAGIQAAVICVSLVNRLKQDQVTISHEELDDFQTRPWKLVMKYIMKHIRSIEVNGK